MTVTVTIHHNEANAVDLPPVDMIFTDPPYDKKAIQSGVIIQLAEIANSRLRPGGYLFCYMGNEYIPICLDQLRSEELQYFWIDTLVNNSQKPRMWYKKLMVGAKSLIVFTKGKPGVVTWRGTVHVDEKDKRYHKWGQGYQTPKKLIELLTNPGETVLDPFMGGGMTAVACIESGRNFIGIDSDAASVEATLVRLAEIKEFDFRVELLTSSNS